jgi:hypothetical protein
MKMNKGHIDKENHSLPEANSSDALKNEESDTLPSKTNIGFRDTNRNVTTNQDHGLAPNFKIKQPQWSRRSQNVLMNVDSLSNNRRSIENERCRDPVAQTLWMADETTIESQSYDHHVSPPKSISSTLHDDLDQVLRPIPRPTAPKSLFRD